MDIIKSSWFGLQKILSSLKSFLLCLQNGSAVCRVWCEWKVSSHLCSHPSGVSPVAAFWPQIPFSKHEEDHALHWGESPSTAEPMGLFWAVCCLPHASCNSQVVRRPNVTKYTYVKLDELKDQTVVSLYGVVVFFKQPFKSRGTGQSETDNEVKNI